MASQELRWRRPEPGDHARIMAVIDDWWGGRSMRAMVPRLFLDHFRGTSYIVEDPAGDLVAFLVAFDSPEDDDVTYVHFIGVDPARRGIGLGREIYDRVASDARHRGRRRLAAVTSPVNTASQAFHRSVGFEVGEAIEDYDGPGEARVPMTLNLD